ncbi:MAG: M28 family peptidase [Elainellaceae cyanobacterium]
MLRAFTLLTLILVLALGLHRVQATEAAAPGSRAAETVAFLADAGPRTPESAAVEAARRYLDDAYAQAGYVTEVQTFQYQNYQPLSSGLEIGGTRLRGNAAWGTSARRVVAPLVTVAGKGSRDDFAAAQLEAAIAVVRRSDITVSEQVQHARAANAVGLVIVNSEAGNWSTRFTAPDPFPVLLLSGEQGAPLLETATSGPEATLDLQPILRTTTGHNLVAKLDRIALPRVIIGAHYDSVPGSVGANDNASGTALVLELARRLADDPLAQWVWFVAFDAEERGVAGSQALVASLPFRFNVSGMINFEMLGLNDQLLATGTPELTNVAQAAVPTISVVSDLGVSDHYPFDAQDVPVLVLTRGLHPNKDTPLDTEIDPDLLDEAVDRAEQVVRALLPRLISLEE